MADKKHLVSLKCQLQQLQDNRNFVQNLIYKLEKDTNSINEITNENNIVQPEWKYIWGEKENTVSILVKLTGLIAKIAPLEQQLLDKIDLIVNSSDTKSTSLVNLQDKEIIKRFLAKRKLNK